MSELRFINTVPFIHRIHSLLIEKDLLFIYLFFTKKLNFRNVSRRVAGYKYIIAEPLQLFVSLIFKLSTIRT